MRKVGAGPDRERQEGQARVKLHRGTQTEGRKTGPEVGVGGRGQRRTCAGCSKVHIPAR